MPVGRFREDPRELGEAEREVYARQHAEGLLVVASLACTAIPLAVGTLAPTLLSPGIARLIAVGGAFFGGIAGYLVGYAYRERQLRAIRTQSPADASGEAAE
jgi:membrane protein YqaA with SNARE-associated domain